MQVDILLGFAISVFALAISPGPDNIFVLLQSIAHGVKSGLLVVLGLMTGCLVHTTLVAFGVSALIKESDLIFLVIKIFGASYLFFLAFRVFKSDATIHLNSSTVPVKSDKALFKQGFMMNVLNPKVSIFFLAFFPGFLFSQDLNKITQFYILGLGFIVISFIVFGLIALLSGRISKYVKEHKKIGGFLKWLQIIVFIGIGIFILLSEK
ncbi:LysE family translocator [Aquimarina brevivitae]|uniref:LysE family translocator n=1 Tax=Aquimarina brevivitae TaxID=323412 RepID=UPI001F5F4387|nr:LysE family translocator [Aquimarina brevivitae]